MRKVYSTTLRLDLNDEHERRAWEYLRKLDRRKYHSVSKAVAAAVNAYFDRQAQLAADPYLETREKEDAFLQEIREAVRSGLQSVYPAGITPMFQIAQPAPVTPSHIPPDGHDEDMDAALDFADGF